MILLTLLAALTTSIVADTPPGRFVQLFWFEHGVENGNPNSRYNTRFRVNAPEAVLDPEHGGRTEPRGSGMLQILAERDPRQIKSAELQLALWGGHPGTANRRVTINGRSTYPIPVPGDGEDCTHLYPTIPLKPSDLVNGYNALQFACDQGTSFWGHFIVDQACLRLTLPPDDPALDAAGLADFAATVEAAPLDDDNPESITVRLAVTPESATSEILEVEFQGFYQGYDENGDGQSRDWHGFPKDRRPVGSIGLATEPPFTARWDVSMLPTQRDMTVRAVVRFRDTPDLVYITPKSKGLRTPPGRSADVRMITADNLPHPFWSRAGNQKSCTLPLDVDPTTIERAELHVVAWDGGHGTIKDYFTLNGHPLKIAADGDHDVVYTIHPIDPSDLQKGENVIKLLTDTEHHGIEILHPGPALVIRTKPTNVR